jgi:hypothetical protein
MTDDLWRLDATELARLIRLRVIGAAGVSGTYPLKKAGWVA